MTKELVEHFEQAVRQRNPALVESLRPGLPEVDIRNMISAAEIQGAIESIVSLFSWKNGTSFDPHVTLEQASLFPGTIYVFPDLETMIEHFTGFYDDFVYHPKSVEVVGRYFPLFWDNSTGYLAVDLNSPRQRVVLLDPESEDLARQAYESFEDFLKDGIRANEQNDNMTCFQVI